MTDFFQKNLFKNISLDEYKHLISCMEGRIKPSGRMKPSAAMTQALRKSAL